MGSLLMKIVLSWGFEQPAIDGLVFLKSVENVFLIFVIAVEDLAFVSNFPGLMNHFKSCSQSSFDVKLYDALTSFID